MDVMNVIYNCSDNKLLPILMEKLFLCQLSIPLVFPDRLTNVTTVQLWALRGIVPAFISANANKLAAGHWLIFLIHSCVSHESGN